jgi:signal peptidase I
MSPTLNTGDYFLISERAYDDEKPRYGDVVVFNAPTLNAAYAKRIVALPGDRVQMVAGTLHLNGGAIPKQSLSAAVGGVGNGHQFVETLPGGKQYGTLDMINSGPLDDTAEYTVPPGHYFVVGDNRDNSTDSRGEIGFVDRRDILGKVVLRFWDGTRHWIDDSKIQ